MSFVIYYNTATKERYPNPHFMQTKGYNVDDPEIVELDYTQPEHDPRVETVIDAREEVEVDGVWKIKYEVQPLADEIIYSNLSDSYIKAIEAKALLPFDTGMNGLVMKTDTHSLYLLDSLIKTKQADIQLTLSDPIYCEGELPEDVNELIAVQGAVLTHVGLFNNLKDQLRTYLTGANVEDIKSKTPEQWVEENSSGS